MSSVISVISAKMHITKKYNMVSEKSNKIQIFRCIFGKIIALHSKITELFNALFSLENSFFFLVFFISATSSHFHLSFVKD